MKLESVSILLLVLCIGFVSAGFFNDVFGGITGNVVLGEDGVDYDCGEVRIGFNKDYLNYSIPEKVPFDNELFAVYVDDEFFATFELVEKDITEMTCEIFGEVTYNIYITSELVDELQSGDLGEDAIGFYNEKKKSGELRIDAVGFMKRLKLGFINFGLKIFGWFN
jgi:hypothetical protein